MRAVRIWIRSGLVLVGLGILVLTTLPTAALGHVGGTVDHLWVDHIRPRADVRYYTKAQANDRFARAPMWAHVKEDDTVVAQSGGVSVDRADAGRYFVTFPRAAVGKPIVATVSGLSLDVSGEISVTPCGGGPQGVACAQDNTTNTVWVQITGGFGAHTDMAFFVRVG
jgi:hypothetical protein